MSCCLSAASATLLSSEATQVHQRYVMTVGSAWRHGCGTNQNSARSSQLSHCEMASRLECPSCLPQLNIHQFRTIQSWVKNPSLQPSLRHSPRTFCLRVYLYLLTYNEKKKINKKLIILTSNFITACTVVQAVMKKLAKETGNGDFQPPISRKLFNRFL